MRSRSEPMGAGGVACPVRTGKHASEIRRKTGTRNSKSCLSIGKDRCSPMRDSQLPSERRSGRTGASRLKEGSLSRNSNSASGGSVHSAGRGFSPNGLSAAWLQTPSSLPPVSNRKRSALRYGTESGRKPLETNSKLGRIEGKVCPFAPPSLQNRQKKLRLVVYGAFFYCVSTKRDCRISILRQSRFFSSPPVV